MTTKPPRYRIDQVVMLAGSQLHVTVTSSSMRLLTSAFRDAFRTGVDALAVELLNERKPGRRNGRAAGPDDSLDL